MQLRRIYAASRADSCDFFAARHTLTFFHKEPVIMRIGRNPPIIMLNQNQVAETFKLVSGISNHTFVGGLNICAERGFDVYAVIGPPFADGTEV